VYRVLIRPSGVAPTSPSAADSAAADTARTPEAGVSLAAPATASGPALRLEVLPRGDCWVSLRADGELAIYRVMRPGEHEVVEADDSLVLSVGDAGAFVYRINGAPGRPLGGPGAVVTVRITEGTYRTFLADAQSDTR
jgi:hypothetical protein